MSINNEDEKNKETIDLAAIRRENHQKRNKRRREVMEEDSRNSSRNLSRPFPSRAVEPMEIQGPQEPTEPERKRRALAEASEEIQKAQSLLNNARNILQRENLSSSLESTLSPAEQTLNDLQMAVAEALVETIFKKTSNVEENESFDIAPPQNSSSEAEQQKMDDWNFAVNFQQELFRQDEEQAKQAAQNR